MLLWRSISIASGLSLLLNGVPHSAHASALEDLALRDKPMPYQDFVDAATDDQHVEDARCEMTTPEAGQCRPAPESMILEKATEAYTAHLDRLEEHEFRKRQQEDAQDRALRAMKRNDLFQVEYAEKVQAIRHDEHVTVLPVGTLLCGYPVTGAYRAIVTGSTHNSTVLLQLYRQSRQGYRKDGTGEVAVRKLPDEPNIYELEILVIANEAGQPDHVSLGLTKTVVLCPQDREQNTSAEF